MLHRRLKRINAYSGIGCAGEIRIRKEEAYENWAIDILVKFRDTEKLQLLTSQRQSGGVRLLPSIPAFTLITLRNAP